MLLEFADESLGLWHSMYNATDCSCNVVRLRGADIDTITDVSRLTLVSLELLSLAEVICFWSISIFYRLWTVYKSIYLPIRCTSRFRFRTFVVFCVCFPCWWCHYLSLDSVSPVCRWLATVHCSPYQAILWLLWINCMCEWRSSMVSWK